jgi:putative heme-binding domain-containing protein
MIKCPISPGQFWFRAVSWCLGIAGLLADVSGALAASRTPWTSNRIIGSPNPPAPYTVQRIYSSLGFTNPVDIAALPGSDRLLVLEQGGKLYSFPANGDTSRADLVFDFKTHHQPFDSSFSIAFHPHFSENRFIFVCYTEPGGRTNGSYISRFTLTPSNPPVLDPGSEKVIIRWFSGGHNGCTVAFGNDGFLYFSAGDAGNPDPPDSAFNTGQDISDLLSSIVRIDVDHTEGTNNYAIPRDNPFLKFPGARPEVYAFGLRNPWRMSFDPPTGDLWVGDVGWEQWEMIYRIKSGGNYGWSITEGPNTSVRTDVQQGPGPIQPPLMALPHSDAASITGGRVYHGQKLAKLKGAYIYGDWETGKFWALRHDGDKLLSNDELCDTTLKPVSFAADAKGELLILDYNGGIYQLIPNSAPPANLHFPRKLSETGLFANLPTLAPSAGVVPYSPNVSMWSDYAQPERVVGVPDNGVIATADGLENIAGHTWYFPTNTVFARTLSLELDRQKPSARRRIETQILQFDGQGWNPYTYRWNNAQSDAELVPDQGTNDTFSVTDSTAPGGRREIPWRFVARAECLRCHNAWAGETLSFNWLQLSGTGENFELKRLESLGLLQVKNPPKPLAHLKSPYDQTTGLNDRARAWLQVNCATCHRNGAGGGVPSWFNYELSTEETRTLNARPVRGDFGIRNARVIAPGDPYSSTLFYRINTEGSGHMPHIGSRLSDPHGVALIRDWIASLPVKESGNQKSMEWTTALAKKDFEQLLSTMNGTLFLLDSINSKSLGDDQQKVIALAASHTNALVRDLFQRLLPPDQRRQTLGTTINPQTILALKGNATRGQELFVGASQCARCHVSAGAGRAFGPDLTSIGKKYSRAQLLEQILFPSKNIAPEYRVTALTLADESELSGFILRRSASEMVLRDESLAERTIKLSAIKNARESDLSAMPEGLLAPMTAQEAADLLEYLASNKAPGGAER